MLKAGIFLDMENLNMNGGWNMRLEVIRSLVEAQGTTVLRANAYLAVDSEKERIDQGSREKGQKYRDKIRGAGFHIVEKEVKKFHNKDGTITTKANADLDMAVDTLLQADNLDYIMLGTGDGDFLRLVRALQNKGKRVDVIAFNNVSNELKREADYYFPGATIPKLLPIPNNAQQTRFRGVVDYVDEEKGYGFLSIRTGYGVADIESQIFCHITKIKENDKTITNERYAMLATKNAVIEFDKVEGQKGRDQANNAVVYQVSS